MTDIRGFDMTNENESIIERYELAIDRIRSIPKEDVLDKTSVKDFFVKTSNFIIGMVDKFIKDGTMEELKEYNQYLYEDIKDDNYNKSFANPEYMYNYLLKDYKEEAEKYAKIFSFLYVETRACIVFMYENRIADITIILELFIEIYNLFAEEDIDIYKAVKSAIYYYESDYSDIVTDMRVRELVDPSLDFATKIVMESDLSDLRYLYKYGEYVSDCEIDMAKHLNSLSQEEIDKMAYTYTNGYKMGFENNNIDLSKKSTVNIRYKLGLERMVKSAIEQFKEMGLKPVLYRSAVLARQRKTTKVGYYSSSPNDQYDYDHRYDLALFMDKALTDKLLVNSRMAYEHYEDLCRDYAGPACIEVFGEKDFKPYSNPYANSLSDKQEKLMVDYKMQAAILSNEFMKREEISFTIIAYPVPEIGDNFVDIFNETVKVNTLDMDTYKNIHQHLIDALDKGEYVHIKGCNGNKTDLKVYLQELNDPSKETLFENCLADVNIPVGEVFTSPKLTNTNGVLHVTKVFLEGIEYKDLSLVFKDGKIDKYTCKNFDDEEKCKKIIKENVLFNHDTLPIGEFAIGTNTTAYVMGQNFDIAGKLPILIAEKTGPHFAVGDTCYSMSEDTKVYNPDGKEIIAKDNEISILRKTDMSKAYMNCHTDITIPYNELGLITVCTKTGENIDIIRDGKFVLDGCEKLNEAFDNLRK